VTDEPASAQELEQLGGEHRMVFAASCCERVVPAYEAFSQEDGWGESRRLRDAVEAVWAAAGGAGLDRGEAQRLIGQVEQQVPHLDDPFTSVFAAPAQSAAIAVVEAVKCAETGAADHAAEAAAQAVDAFEAYVDEVEGEGAVYDADRVTSSPLDEGELSDQREDLALLGREREISADLVEQIKTRARSRGFAKLVPSRT
jgi:uncharacterized protein YjaG (DUF416 family)